MNRVVTFVSVLTMLVCGITIDATAQMYIVPSTVTPAKEIGVVASNSNFLEPVGFGARVTVNHSDWFGTEASVDTTKAGRFEPAHTLVIVNPRLIFDLDGTGLGFLTLTAGGAVGIGFRHPLAPMVGFGVQRRVEDMLAVRLDAQLFPGGLIHARTDRRVMVGVALLIPKRRPPVRAVDRGCLDRRRLPLTTCPHPTL
jgi:hypothetical protein